MLVLKEGQALVDAVFEPATVPPADPFVHGAAPCRILTRAGFTDYAGWGTFNAARSGRPVEQPPSPIAAARVTGLDSVSLVPLGATQFRVTLLPWTH